MSRFDSTNLMMIAAILAWSLIIYIGCVPPADDDIIDIDENGQITIDQIISDEMTPGTAGGEVASTVYTLANKYTDAVDIRLDVSWSRIGPDKETGFITVTPDAFSEAREYTSLARYKEKYHKDYKVAVYDSCTPLALECSLETMRNILKHKRSGEWSEEIRGTPTIQAPEGQVPYAEALKEQESLAEDAACCGPPPAPSTSPPPEAGEPTPAINVETDPGLEVEIQDDATKESNE